MSIESARAFWDKIRNDEEFKSKVASKNTQEERIKFIRSEGFDFSEEEFKQIQKELSPEALDQAAGGGCGFTHESEQFCSNQCTCVQRFGEKQ